MSNAQVLVAFYKANGKYAKLDDKLVSLWTRGPYSHVELVIYENNRYTQYSSSNRDGGVRSRPHVYDATIWDYVEVENINAKVIKDFFYLLDGYKYDWRGIFGFVIGIKDNPNKWFCSEIVSKALMIGGCKKLWPYNPSHISPNKLYKILTVID